MIAAELISSEIIPIQTKDSGRVAMMVMNDHYVKHLPVLEEREFKGMISEEMLLDHSLDLPIKPIVVSDIRQVAFKDDHLFMIMSKMADLKLTVLPVLNENQKYIGAIKHEEVLSFYSKNFSFNDPGSILVLEMNRQEYSLSSISRTIESESANILSSFVSKNAIDNKITLTLKLDKLEISTIVATLERMGYIINASYQEAEYFNNLEERYDALMHYLNM